MRVLITAANSDIAIGIARIIKASVSGALLVGIAPDGQDPARHFFDYHYSVPLVTDFKSYTQTLETVINMHDIEIMFPISEAEIKFFSDYNYKPIKKIVINNSLLLSNCLDKYKTFQWLQSIAVPAPTTFLLCDINDISYPVVVKPRSSAGSKNLHYVCSTQHFLVIKNMLTDKSDLYIVQREVGVKEQEYTCALWRAQGDFRHIVLKRELQGGLTGRAEVVYDTGISGILTTIAENINGDFFINVQLRMCDDIPYIFEINPRFSSTVVMRHKLGFKDVLWTILSNFNMQIEEYVPPKLGTKAFRLSDELIINDAV